MPGTQTYFAALVYFTQILSMRQSLWRFQSLTATHDISAAWGGIVAAVLRVWKQRTVQSSIMGVLTVFFYLGNMWVLHITTPALFSVQTFNSTLNTSTPTLGFPEMNLTAYNLSSLEDRLYAWPMNPLRSNISAYAQASLAVLPYIVSSETTVGLYNGTLYETSTDSPPFANLTVRGVGFNVSCGMVEGPSVGSSNVAEVQRRDELIYASGSAEMPVEAVSSLQFYFTVPVVDSGRHRNATIVRCIVNAVNQTVVVDSESTKVVSVDPSIVKTASDFLVANDLVAPNIHNLSDPLSTPGLGLVDLWGTLYASAPEVTISPGPGSTSLMSTADITLNQLLGLGTPTSQILLHDLENTLSRIVGGMLWTLAFMPPTGAQPEPEGYQGAFSIQQQESQGLASQRIVQAQLNLSVFAISVGLAASLALFLFSLYSLNDKPASLGGTGLLHAIWLYRRHPQLHDVIFQVETPAEPALRPMGMGVRATLGSSEPLTYCSAQTSNGSELQHRGSHGSDRDYTGTTLIAKSLASSPTLHTISMILHLTLIPIHLLLLVAWQLHLEHSFIVPATDQATVSLVISVVSQTIGTARTTFPSRTIPLNSYTQIYSAVLTLSATHDNGTAWAGIASAFLCVWKQLRIPASVMGTLGVFLYLSGILGLHVTTPALVSIESFNLSRAISIPTLGFPFVNLTAYNLTNVDDRSNALEDLSLYFVVTEDILPYVVNQTNIGVRGGTIYDVPNIDVTVGNIAVLAKGFNVTCGESTPAFNTSDLYSNLWQMDPGPILSVSSSSWNGISFVNHFETQIVDSSGSEGSPFTLNSTIQFHTLSCSLSLINQTVILDAGSTRILSVGPDLFNNFSAWPTDWSQPQLIQNVSDPVSTPDIILVDLWPMLYKNAIIGDDLLNQQLSAITGSPTPTKIYLHDFENALANVLATLFWTVGTKPPIYGYIGNVSAGLTPGEGILEETFKQLRINLSGIAISVGLVASLLLCILSVCLVPPSRDLRHWSAIDGAGFLQAIWLYQHHPQLDTLLHQVDDPTEENLRRAGMVRVRLADAVMLDGTDSSDEEQFKFEFK
ncbi:hypothetical protein GGX14DRAFT_569409 [Mycena pura]|uniref:Uncharacterized protein n=1 Tax=Mycena pura TaxID=153505 RepID=A0AAD6VBB4_9AGAR|nr:hypothetical protein GGX14DRAFT_569409 [Mycena pura]